TGPEDASNRMEHDELPVAAPYRIRSVLNTVGQTVLAATLPVVRPQIVVRALAHQRGCSAAVRRQTKKNIVGGFIPQGSRSSCRVQPLNGPASLGAASPVHERSSARGVELSRPKIGVARYVHQASCDASHLQPV